MTEPFIVMAKPVGSRCNLACHYCYYLGRGQQGDQPQPSRMPNVLLEEYIRQYITASPGPVVSFIWHGGEPALAGLDFYRRVVELQKQYLPPGWTCWNNLQTNGLLLDDAWCAFLAAEHFDVGLSIDGPAPLHDRYRQDTRGRGSWAGAVAAVRRLQAHEVQPDLLCVVTADSAKDPLAVYRALRDLGTGWIQFIPLLRRSEENLVMPDSVSGEGYGDFLIAVFDEWLSKDLGQTQVQLFAEMSLVWAGGTATPCQMAPTCGRVLVLERDGSVYACDHFVDPAHRLGDLAHNSLRELVDSPIQRRFGDAKRDRLPALCSACPWLAVCNGGCPKDRILPAAQDEFELNYFCPGLRRFFAHAEKPLRQVIELQKKGLPPTAIRAEIRASQLIAWQGVGRNDPCPCGSGRKAKQCCWPKRPA